MKQKLLALTALFFVLAAAQLYQQESATGMLVFDRGINLSIGPLALGRILFINYSQVVQVYEPQVISVEFVNTGSVPYTEHIIVEILDVNFTLSLTNASYVDDYVNVSPLQSRVFTVSYTTDEPGFYWIHAKSLFTNKLVDVWGLYYVNGTKILPPVYVLPPSYRAPGAANVSKYEAKSMARMEIEYPSNITIAQNQSTLVYVVVKSTGSTALNNVLMPITSGGVKIDVIPKIIPEILVGREGIFLISLSAPENLTPGVYPVDFYVRSDEKSQKGHIDVIVKVMPLVEELNLDLLNYAILLKRIRGDARNATLDGKNVTLAIAYIDEGEKNLELARKSLAGGEYNTTRNHLRKVKKNIEDAVLEIARARRSGSLFAVFPIVSILLILIALAIIAFLLFEHHRRKAMKKKQAGDEAASLESQGQGGVAPQAPPVS